MILSKLHRNFIPERVEAEVAIRSADFRLVF